MEFGESCCRPSGRVVWAVLVVAVLVAGCGSVAEAAGAEQPACARPCAGLPDVAQEVRVYITDEGETCTLDPKYKQCILDSCKTTTVPQAMVEHLKQNYRCDLSSSAQHVASVVTIVLALVLALLLSI